MTKFSKNDIVRFFDRKQGHCLGLCKGYTGTGKVRIEWMRNENAPVKVRREEESEVTLWATGEQIDRDAAEENAYYRTFATAGLMTPEQRAAVVKNSAKRRPVYQRYYAKLKNDPERYQRRLAARNERRKKQQQRKGSAA